MSTSEVSRSGNGAGTIEQPPTRSGGAFGGVALAVLVVSLVAVLGVTLWTMYVATPRATNQTVSATTGVFLTIAGASLTFGLTWAVLRTKR